MCIRQRWSPSLSWSAVSTLKNPQADYSICDKFSFGNISRLTDGTLVSHIRNCSQIDSWRLSKLAKTWCETGWRRGDRRHKTDVGIEANPFDIKSTIGNSTFPFCQTAFFSYLHFWLFRFFLNVSCSSIHTTRVMHEKQTQIDLYIECGVNKEEGEEKTTQTEINTTPNEQGRWESERDVKPNRHKCGRYIFS